MLTRNPRQTGLNIQAEILSRGAVLENTFHSLSLRNVPLSAIMISTSSDPLSSTPPTVDTEMLEEAVATSEIFRHCALIYLYRVVRGDTVDLDARTKESLDEVFPLSPSPPICLTLCHCKHNFECSLLTICRPLDYFHEFLMFLDQDQFLAGH